MDKIEKQQHYNNLYGYYQNLFTSKQQEIFENYNFDDLSLAEIAENHDISRNAVFDTLKKVEKALDTYEEKLNLYKKDQKLNLLLDEVAKYTTKDGLDIINQIKEME